MGEIPKRLEPLKETARRLYLSSGNQCAFPGCNKMIINSDGVLLGEVCHIEAALPGGERFNKNQTNEERRGFNNLLILCLDHHKITNDVERYTVEKMKEMKRDHEKKFANAVSKLENSIEDLTKKQAISYCRTLKRINEVLEWRNSEADLEYPLIIFNEVADKLKKLVPDTRNLFSIMIERSKKDYSFLVTEVQKVSGLSREEFLEHFHLLNDHGFIHEIEEVEGKLICSIVEYDSWPLWEDIKSFCNSSEETISVKAIVSDLNFSLLD